MANQLTGKVEYVGAVQAVSTKSGMGFNRRELVIQAFTFDRDTGEVVSDDNHPLFEFSGKSCDKLDGLKVGDKVTVSFKLVGSWYERDGMRRNFTRVVGYDVEVKEKVHEEHKPVVEMATESIPPVPPMPVNDSLPF